MNKIENEEKPEEDLDLVELMKRMETDFHKGVQNQNIYHNSPGELLRDSYEHDEYFPEE